VLRRRYLIAAVVLGAIAIGAVILAAGTKPSTLGSGSSTGSGRTAPALQAKGWINSPPLTAASLKGKVVVYDFWTYSCVNCVRTIPTVRSWYDRYAKDGLVVIGVHSPEFDFEKVHSNVAAAVKKLGVDYPVALDDDMTIWNAFGNSYWPADYIYDRSGHEADVHYGEGDYATTEDTLRRLLGVAPSSPRAVVRGKEGGTDGTLASTEETYNGSERGRPNFASPQPLVDGPTTFTSPATLDRSQHALQGQWDVTGQYVQSGAAGARIVLRYYAGQVNLVMATDLGGPIDVLVQVDGGPARTVHVQAADLYNLVDGAQEAEHTLTLTATAPGLKAFAFTFGG
jgi:thiol-disulfide isomerase/thioredoxin